LSWCAGKKVLLDSALAGLYGVGTKRLNEQVKPQPCPISQGLPLPADAG
jgi:hypothetical protein